MSDETMEVDGRTVELSNLDKVLYPEPGYTKGEVVAHYATVAAAMVPHLAGRPLTLRRFPDGVGKGGFYQKAASGHFPPWVHTADLDRRGEPGTIRHVVVDDAATLVYLANQGTVEFHVWPSRSTASTRPDRLVVDLDPPDGTELSDVRAVVRSTRTLVEDLGLVPFLQTTGSRAYHVVAPLDGADDFATVGPLAHGIAAELVVRDPDRLTAEGRKAKRGGRIFVDVGSNAYGQMVVAPYSLRARPRAPVATPIEWSELSRTKPDGYRLDNIGRRLARKRDPWAAIDDQAGSAAEARRRLAVKAQA